MISLRSTVFLFPLAVIATCGGGCQKKALPPANSDTIVTIGSSATVKVLAFGDLEINYPSTIYLKRAASDPYTGNDAPLALIEAEFRRDLQARTIEEGITLADYAWGAIAKDPDRYLVCSDDRSTVSETDINYSTGSGFVVTTDGTVVTCQHCVMGGPVPGYLNAQIFQEFIRVLTDRIGAAPSVAVMQKASQSLYFYLRNHIQTTSIFKEARVLVPQVPRDFNGYNSLSREESGNSLIERFLPTASDQLRKWSWSSTILAAGERWPGKDVAILKIPAVNLFTVRVSEAAPPRPDSPVLCLGFPGKAVQEGSMTKEAQFRVILHRGQVGQLLPTTSGYDAIHTDADINHGDSGGPALNEEGFVIGLSVSGQEDAPGQNYLVPASVILEKLAEAGIKMKEDSLNTEWREGLLLLQAKQYAEAKDVLIKLKKQQDNDFTNDPNIKVFGKAPKDFVPNTVNFFLDRAINDCNEGLKGK